MRWITGLALAGATAAAPSLAQTTVPAVVWGAPNYELVTYPAPETVTCADGPARVVDADEPPPRVAGASPMVPPVAVRGSPGPIQPRADDPPSFGFRFNIDAEGRTTGVQRSPELRSGYDPGDHALQAAIATWRFEPGRARSGCRHVAEPRRTPLAALDRRQLFTVMATSGPGRGAAEVRRGILRPGADCMRDRPDPRELRFPAFSEIKAPPGRRDWVWLDYDLDAGGRPVGVSVASSSGNAALDGRAVEAMRGSRFEPGARRGCVYSFWRNADTLAAPPRPNLSTWVRPEDDCPNTESRGGRVKLVEGALAYPPSFRQRSIEGWAVVRFDVASWGAIGPAEVVAAEPAAAFGQAAQNVLRSARADPGPGWRGCLQHFNFKMAEDGEEFEFERDLRVR